VKRIALTSLLASLLTLSADAFATDLSGAGFTAAQLRSGLEVYTATITNLLAANADKTTPGGSALGTGVGAALGAIGGSSMGHGNGKAATTIVGTVLGGLVGNAVSNATQDTTACAQTFIVHLDNPSKDLGVTQECSPKGKDGQPLYTYAIGQKVQLLVAKADGTLRVVPAQ